MNKIGKGMAKGEVVYSPDEFGVPFPQGVPEEKKAAWKFFFELPSGKLKETHLNELENPTLKAVTAEQYSAWHGLKVWALPGTAKWTLTKWGWMWSFHFPPPPVSTEE